MPPIFFNCSFTRRRTSSAYSRHRRTASLSYSSLGYTQTSSHSRPRKERAENGRADTRGDEATRFKAGNPGRPKGALNKATLEIKAFARALVADPTYREKLLKDFKARKLAPAIEALYLAYGYGRPKEQVEIAIVKPLSDDELRAEILDILKHPDADDAES